MDLDRITHVISLDIPQSAESYIHRIGRTGRAGRKGKALLFVSPRERRMLQEIERVVSHQIKSIKPPSVSQVQMKRTEQFKVDVMQTLAAENIDHYREMIEAIALKSEYSELDIAAAIAYLAHKDKALSMQDYEDVKFEEDDKRRGGDKKGRRQRSPSGRRRRDADRRGSKKNTDKHSRDDRKSRRKKDKDESRKTYGEKKRGRKPDKKKRKAKKNTA